MADFALNHRALAARTGQSPHPCLILLHGLGDTEEGLFSMASQLDPRLYVVSARAPFPYQWGGFAWYDIERHGPGLGSESIEHALGLLDAFLDQVVERYPVDPQRLYLGGFSMGAAMSGALALLWPERVAGAVMVSGYLPPDPDGRYRPQDAAGHPFFQATGTLDPLVTLQYAHMTRDYLRGTPVDLTYREYPVAHAVSMEEMQELAAWMGKVLDAGERRPANPEPRR